MHKAFRYTICNKFLVPQTPCVKKKCVDNMAGRCTEKRKQQKTCIFLSFFFYLAFVEVVDGLLVEPLLQLPLGRRLVPVPLGEVGRAHVLRPLRQKQSVSGALGGPAVATYPSPGLRKRRKPGTQGSVPAVIPGTAGAALVRLSGWNCAQNLCAEASR